LVILVVSSLEVWLITRHREQGSIRLADLLG
jgi:hypothetical protein